MWRGLLAGHQSLERGTWECDIVHMWPRIYLKMPHWTVGCTNRFTVKFTVNPRSFNTDTRRNLLRRNLELTRIMPSTPEDGSRPAHTLAGTPVIVFCTSSHACICADTIQCQKEAQGVKVQLPYCELAWIQIRIVIFHYIDFKLWSNMTYCLWSLYAYCLWFLYDFIQYTWMGHVSGESNQICNDKPILVEWTWNYFKFFTRETLVIEHVLLIGILELPVHV